MSIAAEVQGKIESAVAEGDEEALQKLLNDLYEPAERTDKPFDAAIQLRPEIKRQLAEVAVESDAAMNWANRIGRATRWLAYRRKTAGGFDGLRIVEEGDSWFQYPLLLDDTIDQLSRDEDKAIFSLSGAGDLLGDMADRREYVDALTQTAATVMLLSGGGNDMLGGGRFASFLLTYSAGKTADDLLNVPLVETELRKATDAYRRILKEVRQRFPRVQVFGHAYDVPHPQGEGRWIGKPLTERGIPLDIGRSIVESVLDRFAGQLRALQGEFSNFRFVDLRGKVDRGRSSWFDELHPKNPGYGRAAQAFRDAIAELASEGALEFATAGAAIPVTRMAPGVALLGLEATGRVIVLDPGHGGAPPPTKVGGSSWNNAIGPDGTLEKTLTLDVAGRVKANLESHGHQVFLTRTGDVNLSLAQRAALARTRSAAVFVSIHFNASTGHNAQGTETFVHTDHTDASRRLCLAVQRAMVGELGLHDRNASHPGGIKEGVFGVINGSSHAASTAAVLHEVSFLDRADEERKLKTEAYRDRIARALARGIETYLGAGVESLALETASDEIGDAIELGALEAGQSVPAYLGAAEAEASGWVGGYALPVDGMAASDGDLARQIAEGLARDLGTRADDVGNDVHEFAYVDPGTGFNVSDMGRSVEADTGALTTLFAGVESAGFDMARYEAFIRGLGLRHFVPAEFLFLGNSNAPGARCSGRNALPPENLWGNIAKTARMLDEIRKRLGAPIRILSCYRNAAYNGCVGGERNSRHMQFNAIDWRCDSGTVDRWHQVAMEVRRSNPELAGGIGRYPRQGFIHVDTRGSNADWNG
ncbi:N-acetylmuramoyl-L-alanine amidase [Rhizobium azooxidifex]|uniref:N-acetylmuramoyl-L-alanine amidase n=1 Tax=Mycoplana azooxidifex TaxID=1636188 RepID=A0A7W6GMW2_9HYPH|nr:N-acetylmuramoyl-L-alanine amidase [Mycoplana azooxidifex]MBB3979354.1 N-acetylmuramoyl-L-alanine amidase [Mycoplana azooxidifex]